MRRPGVALLVLALAAVGCTAGVDSPSRTSSGVPSGTSPSSPATTWTVATSTFEVVYRLDGVVNASAAVGIDVPAGTRLRPAVPTGNVVAKGDVLGSLRLQDASSGAPAAGTVAESRRRLVAARLATLVAPTSGRARLTASSARVDNQGLDVVVPLKPLQELRYRGLRLNGTATVETVLGQRQSDCVAVWIQPIAAAAAADSGSEPTASAAVHCRLAADLETAAGLPAVLTLASVRQSDVVAVPLIYIGLDKTGENYVARVRRGAAFVEQPVVVGSTDGVRRVITKGLAPGDVLAPMSQP